MQLDQMVDLFLQTRPPGVQGLWQINRRAVIDRGGGDVGSLSLEKLLKVSQPLAEKDPTDTENPQLAGGCSNINRATAMDGSSSRLNQADAELQVPTGPPRPPKNQR